MVNNADLEANDARSFPREGRKIMRFFILSLTLLSEIPCPQPQCFFLKKPTVL